MPILIEGRKNVCLTYLGLGSNLGDREGNLIQATRSIGESCRLLRYSSIYRTSPVGNNEQPDFLNMVVAVDTCTMKPRELLSLVKSIERKMGRSPTFRWGPRLIDIDIL